MNRDELLKIGDVARLYRVSVSSLRHYEALGLLTPAWVDPETDIDITAPANLKC